MICLTDEKHHLELQQKSPSSQSNDLFLPYKHSSSYHFENTHVKHTKYKNSTQAKDLTKDQMIYLKNHMQGHIKISSRRLKRNTKTNNIKFDNYNNSSHNFQHKRTTKTNDFKFDNPIYNLHLKSTLGYAVRTKVSEKFAKLDVPVQQQRQRRQASSQQMVFHSNNNTFSLQSSASIQYLKSIDEGLDGIVTPDYSADPSLYEFVTEMSDREFELLGFPVLPKPTPIDVFHPLSSGTGGTNGYGLIDLMNGSPYDTDTGGFSGIEIISREF